MLAQLSWYHVVTLMDKVKERPVLLCLSGQPVSYECGWRGFLLGFALLQPEAAMLCGHRAKDRRFQAGICWQAELLPDSLFEPIEH